MKQFCMASLALCLFISGCATKNEVGEPPSPLPETSVVIDAEATFSTKPEGSESSKVETSEKAQMLLVYETEADETQSARKNEPHELKEILEIKGGAPKGESAVAQMRPAAIREAAQLATFQKAIAWRYGQLVAETGKYGNIMDTAFNFSPLLLTQGEALIMPPLIAKSGASMRIEDNDTATSAKATYELLEPARYISAAPTWREFLMVDNFPKPEEPNPALLPQNSAERAIWREAVRHAWHEGIEQADQLFADNVARMTREYRGVMLYHLLTAQHLLSKLETASANLGRYSSGNGMKLNIGQRVFRITRASAFILKPGKKGQKK